MADALYFFAIYYLLIFVCQTIISDTTDIAKPKSGPYTISLTKTNACENNKTGRPYEKEPSVKFYCEVYNTTKKTNLLRGYTTVLKDKAAMSVTFKGFYLVDGQKQLGFQLSNIGCKSIVFNAIFKIMGLKFEKKTCAIPKGNYTFQNIDYNALDHLWMSRREYGVMIFRAEVFNRGLTTFCWESTTFIEPLLGRYTLTVIKTGPCESNGTGRPYEKDHSIEFYCEIYDTTVKSNMIRGYAAVLKDNDALTANLKVFYLKSGRRQLVFQLTNVSCRSIAINTFLRLFGIPFNKRTCSIKKGNYTFQNIDYNVVDHSRMSTREYGEVVYRAEIFSGTLTAVCWESLTVINPLTAKASWKT